MASQIPIEDTSSPAADEKAYTIDQVKAHGSRESLWMILHDKVYDVTKFMDENVGEADPQHPGGDEVMMEEAGRDATEAFEDVGHSDEARGMLPKMFVGDFKGDKTAKAKKAVAATTSTAKSAGSAIPIWIFPLALFGAYLAWRLFYA